MDLTVTVYGLTRRSPFSRDFALVDQSHRAAISIASNIAEGFDRGSRAEFHRFLSIAKGSCAELCTQLHLAHRLGYIDEDTAEAVIMDAEELGRIIGGLRTKVAKQRDNRSR